MKIAQDLEKGQTWEFRGGTITIEDFDIRWDKVNDIILDEGGEVSQKDRQELEESYSIACGPVTTDGRTHDGWVYIAELLGQI